MGQIGRVFLGWKRPAIQSSVEHLIDRYEQNGLVDLTHVTVVTPTRRAGRRLREVLLDVAETRQLGLFPPQIATVGSLPELLYDEKLPFATSLVQQFAWVDALKKANQKTLAQIVPRYPENENDPRWTELGALLHRQHLELADNRLDFATVAERGREQDGFTDFARWKALAKVQARYLSTLDDLELWDRQTARNYAVEHAECAIQGELFLLGTVDLSRTVRDMIDLIADQVTSLVFAEPRLADRFDEFGCVLPDAWHASMLSVEDHHILVADGPANQADAVVYALDAFDGKYSADDFTIGVPDASLVPHLQSRMRQFDIDVRWGPGRTLAASPPVQWLRIVADYLTADRYEPFAELLRHNDTMLYLAGLEYGRDAVKELDKYFEKHLPDRIRLPDPNYVSQISKEDLEGPCEQDAAEPTAMSADLPGGAVFVLNLLQSLRGKEQPPAAWCAEIQDVLSRLYDRRQLNIDRNADRVTLLAYDQLQLSVERISSLPDSLAPPVSASAAILMLLSQLDDEEVPPAAGSNVIEMVGWLDLPLDDAKVAIVTNMNDGVVPKSVSSDVFLPNKFRETLGLDDNARRYARDAYALQALLESRMAVRLILGRRAATNDPLRPSRLLMATHSERLAERCLRLFNGKPDCPPIVMPVDHDELRFHVPRPTKLPKSIDSLSVSDFASFLTCPYRFYLRKAQRIRALDDRLTELDASTFGTLAHDVLEHFGKSEYFHCSNVADIKMYLHERLVLLARRKFGKHPKPTVQVQLAQLRLRFDAFAEKQAEWRSLGWKILRTELVEDHGQIVVDGQPIQLKGRIDRIDHRVKDGEHQYAVLDYKTGDAGDGPRKKHLKGHRDGEPIQPEHWVDLQLPLYRYLLKSIDGLGDTFAGDSIRLGYILLPSVAAETRFELATWSDENLLSADRAAEAIVRRIREEEFWPPTDPFPYKNFDDYAAIVQHGVFGREPFAEANV